MTIVAGLDEAGLGPLLGPLVLGYSALRVAPGREDLWQELAGTVSRDNKRDADHLIVDDSKAVFTRNRRGRRRLENTALCFLALLHPERQPPRDASWMFAEPLRPARELVELHPWYAALPEKLPLYGEAGAVELRAERLWRALGAADAALLDAGVRVVPAGELNASYDRTASKATTLWKMSAKVLRFLWQRFSEEGLCIYADQQGARENYGKALAAEFPGAEVRLIDKGEGYKLYELTGERRPGGPVPVMRLHIAPKADQVSFCTALASCLAKYARETCMGAFNDWFARLQPGLKPTAGYTTDGRRWLAEAGAALSAARLPPRVLKRER